MKKRRKKRELRETIFEICGADALRLCRHRATLYGRAAYLENIRGLLCFEPEKIVLRLKRGKLTVEGENLSIGRYAEGDLLILGDIRKFEVNRCETDLYALYG